MKFICNTNGNMITDLDRDIVTIKYNVLNLPELIQFGNGNQIINKYDATGKKLQADYYTLVAQLSAPLISGEVINIEDYKQTNQVGHSGSAYVSNFEYDVWKRQQDVLTNLKRVYNSEGYVLYFSREENYYAYFCKDHLGSNREVWLAYDNGLTIQRTQYYPSGLPWKEGEVPSEQPYKYNGKEWIETHGYDSYDFHARGYYPAIMRFTTPDPLATKYYPISPYAYCANNPINRIDPDGKDWYVFNKSDGQYDKKIEQDGTNRMVIHSVEKTKDGLEYDSYTFVDFADPVEDAKDIESGQITQYISVSEKDMQSMLDLKGAFDTGKIGFGWESQGGGNFDYSYTTLPYKYPQTNFNKETMKSNALFLPEGDYTAHNYMNFGNYLWGATGYTVGFGYGELQIGAHLNSKYNSKRNGYPSEWDSKDDQRSIILGVYHAQQMGYRKKGNKK